MGSYDKGVQNKVKELCGKLIGNSYGNYYCVSEVMKQNDFPHHYIKSYFFQNRKDPNYKSGVAISFSLYAFNFFNVIIKADISFILFSKIFDLDNKCYKNESKLYILPERV
jgi:hypothetical protein